MTIIIGLIGYAGSGKDTAFQLIKLFIEKGAERLAFADKLKDIADNMLEVADFDRVATSDNRDIKYEIRPLLVWLGEYARKKDPDYWLKRIKPDLDYLVNAKCPMVVFTDVRYLNEAKFIFDRGGYLVYIDSEAQPANSTEANSIAEIIRAYRWGERFFRIYNARSNTAEYSLVLSEVINRIRGIA